MMSYYGFALNACSSVAAQICIKVYVKLLFALNYDAVNYCEELFLGQMR